MPTHCDAEGCENEAVEVVPVSTGEDAIWYRRYCHPCSEAYHSGAQHGMFRAARQLRAHAEGLCGQGFVTEAGVLFAAITRLTTNDDPGEEGLEPPGSMATARGDGRAVGTIDAEGGRRLGGHAAGVLHERGSARPAARVTTPGPSMTRGGPEMATEQKGNNPDPTTAAGFEAMVRRLLGLGPNDGLCEHCVYLTDADVVDGGPSPCGGCTDWDRFVRAVPRPRR